VTPVFLLSFLLLFIGLVGACFQRDFIKIFISLEISVFGSIVNFSCFSGDINAAYFTILVAVMLGCLTFSVIFAIANHDISFMDSE
jgi:NADH:ubiquinone oxidoreductase subunit K